MVEPDGEKMVYVLAKDEQYAGDAVSFATVWRILWSRRWIILIAAGAFAVTAVAYALLATEWYRAEVLLAPAESEDTNSLSGTIGGLASLAGIAPGETNSVEPLAILSSRRFAEAFIREVGLMQLIYADEWDASASQWRESASGEQPDIRDGVKFFREEILRVNEDDATGLVNVSIDWTDPEVAATWANLVVQRLNENTRARSLAEAERNVAFLREELQKTQLMTLQQSVGSLLESEIQKLMLARGRIEFSFRVIDPAVPPLRRSYPQRTLIVLAATVLGGFLGVLIALFLGLRNEDGTNS